ncbi:hypothetical protein ABZX75_12460 [Streptomyces sp. NPDC003038]|uniref:hypothetical protein n=1 Tax=unclassified Streptomyces TaxID=2593676 RepID=UPI00339E05AD
MRVLVTVVQEGTPPQDVVVNADESATARDVAQTVTSAHEAVVRLFRAAHGVADHGHDPDPHPDVPPFLVDINERDRPAAG